MLKDKYLFIIGLAVLIIMFIGAFFYFNENDLEKKEDQDINENIIQEAKSQPIKKIEDINENDNYWGSLDAPAKIIIYSNFECEFCVNFNETIKQAKEEFGDKVVIAWRHFSLKSHTRAVSAEQASECAGDQGNFWQMHDKFFARDMSVYLGDELFMQYAVELGLDEEEFDSCLKKEKYKDKILSQIEDAKSSGVLGAPSSFINGEPVPGAYPFLDFVDSQEREREGIKSIILKHLES